MRNLIFTLISALFMPLVVCTSAWIWQMNQCHLEIKPSEVWLAWSQSPDIRRKIGYNYAYRNLTADPKSRIWNGFYSWEYPSAPTGTFFVIVSDSVTTNMVRPSFPINLTNGVAWWTNMTFTTNTGDSIIYSAKK